MAAIFAPPLVAILAGGRGERLGGDKPSTRLGGRPLISYPLAAAHEAGLEMIVVAKPDTRLPQLQERIVYDADPRHHPLAGVIAALRQAPSVIALACDMPFVPSALLRWMAEQPARAIVTRPGNFLQPFPALYGARHLLALEAALSSERSLQDTLDRLHPLIVDDRDLRAFGTHVRLFFSVNTPADLASAESWLAAQERAGAAAE